MTIVLVTNDETVAAAADRTLRMRDGRVVSATPAAAPLSASASLHATRVERADQRHAERKREPPREDAGREVGLGEGGDVALRREELGGEVAEQEPEGERDQPDAGSLAEDEQGDPPLAPSRRRA